ncbi:addiction module toxin RelE (plasmid) [Legionella geestiana]|uniref:type II toxin-antitoxin system RelE/ParE family toxin n=1 Tax=Legionella geestiana TaxID=45065 RepID=UPI001092C010|nr:type II toxin-antitoxin system RelE/ParE family toxin [Legionella geestiana]QDQ41200.1 addiction module toxin RelE [Legionella geestiana]
MKEIYIKSTPAFDRKAERLMTEEALEDFFDHIEKNPKEGKVITGTGGVRKIRWRKGDNDKGKSGGVRILYHYSDDLLVLLITLFGKSDTENISQAERNELKRTVPLLVAKYKGEL